MSEGEWWPRARVGGLRDEEHRGGVAPKSWLIAVDACWQGAVDVLGSFVGRERWPQGSCCRRDYERRAQASRLIAAGACWSRAERDRYLGRAARGGVATSIGVRWRRSRG
jgi:hypothetical protein